MFVCVCVCLCIYIYTYTQTYRQTDGQTHRPTRTHTHTNTHTHLCMQTKMEQFVARERLGSVDENLSAKVKRVVLGPFMAQQDGEDQIGCALYICVYIYIYIYMHAYILYTYTHTWVHILYLEWCSALLLHSRMTKIRWGGRYMYIHVCIYTFIIYVYVCINTHIIFQVVLGPYGPAEWRKSDGAVVNVFLYYCVVVLSYY